MEVFKRFKIGIDLDDVLWDLLGAWLERYNLIVKEDLKPQDIKSWDIGKYLKKGSKEMLFYILERSDFWKDVKPMADSQKYFKKLVEDESFEVYVVTASDYKIVGRKIAHFNDLFPFFDLSNLIITKSKQMVNVDVLVDDNPANLKGGDYIKLLFDAPHNKCVDSVENGLFRVNSWKEIYNTVKNLNDFMVLNKGECR